MAKLEDDLSPAEILILKDRMDRPDPLKLLADLAKIFADPERAEKSIKRFETEKAAAERAKTSLAEARAKHDEHLATTTAEIDQARASLRKRELEFTQREGNLARREERLKEREDADARRSGRLETFHGGMTREREPFAETADPHYGSAA